MYLLWVLFVYINYLIIKITLDFKIKSKYIDCKNSAQ